MKPAARARMNIPCPEFPSPFRRATTIRIAAWRYISHQHKRWHCKCYFPFDVGGISKRS
jgi:hypothetical protein